MNVPLLDLKLQYQSIKPELDAAVLKVAETQMLILGDEVKKLETSLAEYCGTSFAVGVSSGTDALLMAMMALDIKPGDQVILPDYSFFATAGVVARLGATPVFIDSDPVTMNIEPEGIKNRINAKTKAIIPVHLYGQAADMSPIMEIANEYGIPVIEDCAQAIGADYSNQKAVGSMGLMGCYSFYPTKNLGAFGDGGLVVTNDEATYTKLMQMRNHGMEPKYHHKFVGGNFRLDAIQAAVLNVKFPHLESWHEKRRQNAELYSKFFKEAGLAEKSGMTEFNDKNKVLMPKSMYKKSGVRNYHIFNQYIIRVENRDEMRAFLSANSIGSEIYYPVPFHKQECFAYLGSNPSHFPVSSFAAEHSIALPIFPELQEEQIAFVVEKIAEFVRK